MQHRFRYFSLTFDLTPGAVETVLDWIHALGTEHGLSAERQRQTELCAAELVRHAIRQTNPEPPGNCFLGLLLDQDTVTLTLEEAPGEPGFTSPPDGKRDEHLSKAIEVADQWSAQLTRERHCYTARLGCQSLTARREDRRKQNALRFPVYRKKLHAVHHEERSGFDRRSMGFVAHSPLFRDVPYSAIAPILARCEIRDVPAEDVLFRPGEHHRCVLVVIEGRLEVRLDGARSNFCVELNVGECVGELSVADGKPVSAWIVAAQATRVLVIPESVFLGSVLHVPGIARNLIVLLSDRMRRSNEQILSRMKAMLELESIKRELDLARQIQAAMLPRAPLFASAPGIQGHGFMRAARQVGGDFYDAFALPDQRYFVAIGDVCNKGTPAALFMMRTLTVLRSEATQVIEDIDAHLVKMATRTNDLLNDANDAEQFVTLFFAILDLKAKRLHFINAGHNLPIISLPEQQADFIQGIRNPLIGIFPNLRYQSSACDFPPGSQLLMYTDGVTEAEAGENQLFGDEQLLELVRQTTDHSAEASVERLVAAVDTFADGHPQSDDITLLAIRYA